MDICVSGIDLLFDFGWVYFILVFFMFVGGLNVVNLIDGFDGLLFGMVVIVFGVFVILVWN